MPSHPAVLHDRVRTELVQSLFATVSPTIIMSVGFAVSAWLICLRFPDPALAGLAVAGAVASALRVATVFRHLPEARSPELAPERATVLERRFAVAYIGFAVTLGLFGARALASDAAATHMPTICLLVGYAAGVAAGVGLRPWIAIPSMVAAVAPAGLTAAFSGDPVYGATAAMLAAFLAGGVHSVLDRHRSMTAELAQRITFAGLARVDGLTALPNRLALREWFDANAARAGRANGLAVHYLDLNGFKPVNDRFGHPIGDELLRMVSTRLARILRSGDIAARLGGDEFAVVQFGLGHADEAQFLAQRLCKAIEAPFNIDDRRIGISTCIGYVTSTGGDDLEQLLAIADEALYAAKRSGANVVRADRERGRQDAGIAA